MVTPQAEVSLYVHLPFCKRKCPYCHFFVLPDKRIYKDALHTALLAEWNIRRPLLDGRRLVSLYFGGGTPSLYPVHYLQELIDTITRDTSTHPPDIEITLEANPEELSSILLQSLAQIGINRISLGVQSFSPRLLKILGRHHTERQAIDAVTSIYHHGIKNISIDLMYDLPTQTLEEWQDTLHIATSLPITHLSLYNLTIEPHTAFHKYRHTLIPQQPQEDLSKKMYESAHIILPAKGLKAYEISAFARDNKISIHNTGYWTGRPFLGLGPSAFSYWEGHRLRNKANLAYYTRHLEEGVLPIDLDDHLEKEDQKKELFILALRLFAGVNLDDFQAHYGPLTKDTLHGICELIDSGLLAQQGSQPLLTERGRLLYDTVASHLV